MIDRQEIPLLAYVVYYTVLVALAYPVSWWFVVCMEQAVTHIRRALRNSPEDYSP